MIARPLGGLAAIALLAGVTVADPFGDYWYQGQAEITSYTLSQARYGENHPGTAVLIFVTEDVSATKQVKLDRPDRTPDDAVKVLKLNATRKFNTGIYPYSMMTSVFTPVYADRHPKTLKVTTTSQEWCGHTFTQLNLDGNAYRARLFSYFEREGDRDLRWPDAIPEDAIWTRLRLDPSTVPTGKVRLIPGTIFQRLKHTAWGVHEARIAIADHAEPALSTCTISYPDLDRTLEITFRKAFPHEIESWTDTYASGFGPNAKKLTTTAVAKKRIMSDYWRRNDLDDASLRTELGLD